jgi:hypothetical protein
MLGLGDGPSGNNLKDPQNGRRDYDKGRVYILYAMTDVNTIQAVVVHLIIHHVEDWQV